MAENEVGGRWGAKVFGGVAVSPNESGRQGSSGTVCYWIAVLLLCFNEDQAVHRQWDLLVSECEEVQQPVHGGQMSRKRDVIDG